MTDALDRLIQTKRLIVCVGPGGVGKTTSSAAIALRAARMGRRALVLTIDPAKRLADALGLDGLTDEVKLVPGLEALEPLAETETLGTLHAAMLDTKASYDALLTRITEPEDRERIFANRAYQSFSRTMARSHAYVAMERLLHVVEQGRWDLVVLDTPPTRSALDILDAPDKLVRFLDERIVQFFLGGNEGADSDSDADLEGDAETDAGALGSLGALGGRAALRLLKILVGGGVVGELVSFFGVLAHLRSGFRDRAARTRELLGAPTTSFILTAAPLNTGLADAANLMEGVVERGVPLSLLLFNRAYTPEPEVGDEGASRLGGTAPLRDAERSPMARDVPDSLRPLAEAAHGLRNTLMAAQARDVKAMRNFVNGVSASLPAVTLPRAERELTDIRDLAELLDAPTALDALG